MVRVVIRFLHTRRVSAAMVHCRLVDIYRKEVMSRRSVAKMCSDFKCGQVGTTDNERCGRLTAASAPRTKCMLKQQYSIADQWPQQSFIMIWVFHMEQQSRLFRGLASTSFVYDVHSLLHLKMQSWLTFLDADTFKMQAVSKPVR